MVTTIPGGCNRERGSPGELTRKEIGDTTSLLCYPLHKSLEKKCEELVDHITSCGLEPSLFQPLSKGTDSLVLANRELGVVLKVRRLDSRYDGTREGQALLAIQYRWPTERVAPRVFSFTRYFVLMEYIEGSMLGEFLRKVIAKDPCAADTLKRLLTNIMKKACMLDDAGVRHGELTRPFRHVIVRFPSLEPCFIDFGSSSIGARNPRNLSSIISGLLLGQNNICVRIREILRISDTSEIIRVLRAYKSKELCCMDAVREIQALLNLIE